MCEKDKPKYDAYCQDLEEMYEALEGKGKSPRALGVGPDHSESEEEHTEEEQDPEEKEDSEDEPESPRDEEWEGNDEDGE